MNTNIIIKEENKGRIEAALKEAQGTCRERLIDYNSICMALKNVENELWIPKKAMKGVNVDIDVNAQHFANSYKYTPSSTHFKAVYTGTAWKLTWVGRGECRVPSKKHRVYLTDAAKAAVIERMEQF